MLDKNKFDKFATFDRKLFARYSTLYNIGVDLDEVSDNLIPELMEELFWTYFPETEGRTWKWHINDGIIEMNLYSWYSEYHSWAKADNFDNPDYEWIYEQLNKLLESNEEEV